VEDVIGWVVYVWIVDVVLCEEGVSIVGEIVCVDVDEGDVFLIVFEG